MNVGTNSTASAFGPELDEFARDLAARIDDEASARADHRRPFKEEIFVEIMAEYLAEPRGFSDPEFGHHIGTRGTARIRINGIAFGSEGCHLFLLTSVYSGALVARPVSRPEIVAATQQALRFLKDALGTPRAGAMSEDARALARSLAETWSSIRTVTVLVVCDGVFDGKAISIEPVDGKTVTSDVFDLRSLFRLTAQSLTEIDLDLSERGGSPIACLARFDDDPEYDCILAMLPGALLAALYEEYGVRLLEYNVRAFLGSTNKVNSGIRRTLRTEPNRFLAYNNGISATVRSIEWAAERTAIKTVRGLQIVNGGQTVAALHHAHRVEHLDLSRVQVPVKITMVKDADEAAFVGQVSSYANTQSIVQIADFSANRPFHIELERLSRRVWLPGERGLWFFERTRGQYQVARSREGSTAAALRRFRDRCPPQRKFSKTDLAKFVNAWDRQPHLVSTGAQYNYRAWLDAADAAEWMPDETWYRQLIARAIVFKAAQRAVRDGGFPGYRAQIVAYLVAAIAENFGVAADLDAIWRNQRLSTDFEALLAIWASAVDGILRSTAGRRNVTQWCKQADCWAAVKATELPVPSSIPLELRVQARASTSSQQQVTS